MRTYLLLLLSLIVGSAAVNASDMPPTPRITLDSPARSELIGYTGETLTFSSSTSSANCGTINQRRWRLDSGSYVYATNFTHTFTLPAGVYEKTYTLELRTRNTCNLYKTETKTITIRRDKRVYFVKDHLGSVRATVNEAGDVISHDDYYPFGLTMPGRSANTANPNDNYKFTGHERDDEANLTLDYMMARNYDPIIGRFLQIDPLADQFPAWNPYHYVYNNPQNYTDPTGENPLRAGITAVKIGKKLYKAYKRAKNAGKSLTKNDLKKIGLDEIADIADDLNTLFDSEGSTIDRIKAVGDLVIGTDLNNKVTRTTSKTKDAVKKSKRRNRVDSNSPQEAAEDKLDGLEKAQDAAKKEKKGAKQNKIKSTEKSKQKAKYERNRIDLDEQDEN